MFVDNEPEGCPKKVIIITRVYKCIKLFFWTLFYHSVGRSVCEKELSSCEKLNTFSERKTITRVNEKGLRVGERNEYFVF